MTLYLKYRPQTLEELDSQSARESLKKIIFSGNVPHAFLFYGPRGTGKTSAARIVAKILNCEKNHAGKMSEPCNKCEQCLSITKGTNIDVIEMDAASHRGIDDARFLRDAVKLSPAKADKKVYILDEVHMLTTEAANALLKTIEEPPEHVVFILATTNPEKLITTIRSRAVEIPFKKASSDEIVRSLLKVVKGEKLKLDKESLVLIAKAASGSFRDSIKILEQIITENVPQKFDDVEKYLSRKTFNKINSFIFHLDRKNIAGAIADIEDVVLDGISVADFVGEVLENLRAVLLAKAGVGESDLLQEYSQEKIILLIELMLKAKESIASTALEQLPLEVAVIKWCSEENVEKKNQEEKKGVNGKNVIEIKKVEKQQLPKKKAVEMLEAKDILSKSKQKRSKPFGEENWQKVLSLVKPVNTSVEALLRAAKPLDFDGRTLTLAVFYRFHKERLEEEKYRSILESIVNQVLCIDSSRVVCTLAEPSKKIDARSETILAEPPLTGSSGEDIIEVAKKIFS